MADFPQSHTTTTTTTTTVTTGRVQFDPSYIRTIPAILRILQLVLCLIVFICSISACQACSGYIWLGGIRPVIGGECGWAGFVSFMGFIGAIVFLIFYLLSVSNLSARLPWLLIDLIGTAAGAVFMLTAAIALAVQSARWSAESHCLYSVHAGTGAGSFFAFAATAVMGVLAFFLFKQWRTERTMSPHVTGHA